MISDNRNKIINTFKNGLTALSMLTQIPISFYNTANEITWECLPEKKLCSCFNNDSECNSFCNKTHSSAIRIASQLKEPYVFLCDIGLVRIVYPIILNQQYEGCIFAGPVPMGKNFEHSVKHLSENLPIYLDSRANLAQYLATLKVYSPDEIGYIHVLFYDIIKSAIAGQRVQPYLQNTKSYLESNSMATKIVDQDSSYPYQLESDLLEGIKAGNVKMIKTTFKDFFDIVCALEAGNMSSIKISLMSIYGQISRLISEYGFSGSATIEYLDSLEALNNAMSYKAAFDVSLDLFCNISAVVAKKSMDGRSPMIIKAVRYINEHYSEGITLESAANSIHVSAAYLSTLFKREIGLTFTSYLSEFRIHQSVQLLTKTSIDLTTVAYAVGFNSQSYFAKVFKETTGFTPKEYRRKKGKTAESS